MLRARIHPPRRHASTAAALTLLHRTRAFVPRALPEGAGEPWPTVLSAAQTRLSAPPARPRIVVYGFDGEASGADALLDALLAEPFGAPAPPLHERCTPSPSSEHELLVDDTHAPWLQQLPGTPELVVLRADTPPAAAQRALLGADVPLLVYNALATPPSALRALAAPLRTGVLVLAGAAHASAAPPAATHLRTLHADPWAARTAVRAVQADSTPRAVQRYQDGFASSGISALTPLLAPPTRADGALALVEAALADARTALAARRTDAGAVFAQADALRAVLLRAKDAVRKDVLGKDAVARSLVRAEAEVRSGMKRLDGWRLLYLAGEVEYTVNALVAQAWFTDLEPELLMHAGRLVSLQQRLYADTSALVASLPASYSPTVLSNTLAQLASSPSFTPGPHALTAPLAARRGQLRHPAARLHAAAQRVLGGLGAGAVGSAALAGAGWVGTPLSAGAFEGTTALGVGALGLALSARWAVGRWARARKRWWEDWARVGAGVQRDLAANVDAVMDGQVALVPARACDEIERAADAARAEVREAGAVLGELEGALEEARKG